MKKIYILIFLGAETNYLIYYMNGSLNLMPIFIESTSTCLNKQAAQEKTIYDTRYCLKIKWRDYFTHIENKNNMHIIPAYKNLILFSSVSRRKFEKQTWNSKLNSSLRVSERRGEHLQIFLACSEKHTNTCCTQTLFQLGFLA